jgi:hypothetical protein
MAQECVCFPTVVLRLQSIREIRAIRGQNFFGFPASQRSLFHASLRSSPSSQKPVMNLLKKLLRIQTFTPVGFLCWAALFLILYGVCECAGWREHTTFLTGTATSETDSLQMSSERGLIYMMFYFGFVLVVPILVLAAGIFRVIARILRRREV